PPGSCNGRKGDCPGCTGSNCNPQSEAATGHPGTSEQYGAANLLGWCLIAVAGTSYLYKLLV
ncbi:hypothetical protein, partial [Macellibacteroides fermentans]|uniref:hypothetical protein n=1 Tax=Macellibacteroides fermentans TaxID=879969 RepID=UPI00159128DA